ncbi:hypothetical protein GCM10009863_39050 [Streptomyces axinellae]|uniref:Uncharacterized protein n=1 Tax=Streptomyces axinellae TaxID=552788 RepID=A0ABP6CKW1_9ACTN
MVFPAPKAPFSQTITVVPPSSVVPRTVARITPGGKRAGAALPLPEEARRPRPGAHSGRVRPPAGL